MSRTIPRPVLEISYEAAAQEYLRRLPLEHFMEATTQGTQRKITLESLDLVHAARPEIQLFNELLVQYPRKRRRRPGQVVPDNMVVVWKEPIDAEGSYNTPLQPVGPFWVLEYVSRHNQRKDYDDNFDKYERELKVPYFLLFRPEDQELTLYRHTGTEYVRVEPNQEGRLGIPELEIEVAILNGWVRFWFRGDLLPLPADLLKSLEEMRQQLAEAQRRADEETRRAEAERQARLTAEQEVALLRAQLEQLRNRK